MNTKTLLTLALGLLPAATHADDAAWPQWRGPLGNGVVTNSSPTTEWSEEKNVRWKVAVPGSGTSTPIIVGNKIFLLTAAGTGKKVATKSEDSTSEGEATQRQQPQPQRADPAAERPRRRGDFNEGGPLPDLAKPYDKDSDGKLNEQEQNAMREAMRSQQGGERGRGRGGFGRGNKPDEVYQFSVLCLDRTTGKTLWTKVVKEELPHEGHHQDHGYASATPVTDGEHLFASFGSRGLYCLDLDGNVKWEKHLGTMQISNGFGEGASPALAGSSLLVKWDHEGDSFLVALDKTTGTELWRKERDERTSWSTPFIVNHQGVTQVIVSATEKVASYDLKTGEIIWESTGMTRNVIPTPVASDDTVYVMSGFRGAALQAIKLDTKGTVSDSNGLVWSHDEGTPYVPSPLLYQNRLYFFQGNDNLLTCLDAKTGKAHYSRQRVDGIRGVYASPIAANGHIYLVGRKGNVVVIKCSDQLEIVATNTLDDEFDACPATVDNDLFLRGKNSLYCLSAN